ncbi:hypothetical protein [Bradyrhizobium sp. Ai1a-2]|uniref:hypothetical protein n=1 Tax=Bradyrhizobium sp. Ai1a-2 TaxID=196490 RepID=UPI0003F5873F|nr:hypothetical protein [Bradyrhizobium sp. Ai1a-2]
MSRVGFASGVLMVRQLLEPGHCELPGPSPRPVVLKAERIMTLAPEFAFRL